MTRILLLPFFLAAAIFVGCGGAPEQTTITDQDSIDFLTEESEADIAARDAAAAAAAKEAASN